MLQFKDLNRSNGEDSKGEGTVCSMTPHGNAAGDRKNGMQAWEEF